MRQYRRAGNSATWCVNTAAAITAGQKQNAADACCPMTMNSNGRRNT
jgi:hypothetical protein